MADWSELPFELLNEIVMRLETIEGLVYFSVVCRSWNHIATIVKHKFNVKSTSWLLLAESKEDNPDGLRKVFNPFNDKYYELKLPEISGCRCWGSAYGWLVTYNQDFELHLFNPLTKARMSLPPILRLPFLWKDYFSKRGDDQVLHKMRTNFIVNAFVIKVAEDDFVVFVSYIYPWKKLAFARPGDESWTSIDQAGPTEGDNCGPHNLCNRVAEVISRGTQLLISYEDGSLGSLDVCDLFDPHKLVVRDYLPKPTQVRTDRRNLGLKCREYLPSPLDFLSKEIRPYEFGPYMVYSNGDLFMVVRDRGFRNAVEDESTRDGPYYYGTFEFIVYQFDFEDKKWSKVHHLRDIVLFLGNSSSMSVPNSGAGNCRLNSIYYTDDYPGAWDLEKTSWGRDMGIYDLHARP